ncbi:MAG: UDP-N-acetylmuramate--L-alanine ligase [Oscillospiraceae bacterium]|jgi:UDP-N-acetylmuramate--alanine ligase|nr:UDP-N-acetylmuramate--L-alanine ligase [Oscillospiraceae bacterium]
MVLSASGGAAQPASYLKPGRRVHLIGVGGVSMCALAEVLAARGLAVTGSDLQESAATKRLRTRGVPVFIGHAAGHVRGAESIIRTAAARDDNVEVAEARRLGLPVFARAQIWGFLMRGCHTALCIAGTHGKTTATSMATHVALEGGLDPTVMIGGTLPLLGAGHRVGAGDAIILEACEYCDSFLHFSPTLAVVLNVEADHLDYFTNLDAIVDSFRRFVLRVPPETGLVLLCADDPGAMRLAEDLPRRVRTFGVSPSADVRATDLHWAQGCAAFTVTVGGAVYASVALQVPGAHNVTNALAAAAAAHCLGLPGEAVTRGLGAFRGAARRFQTKGMFRGARVVDDYAHHPTEIAATLAAARAMGFARILCAFQPHTYTRTAALFDDFVSALRGADLIFLSEIYAAREQNVMGLSAATLASALPGARFFPALADIAPALAAEARPGDLILTMGAGDIWRVGEDLLARSDA